MKTVHAAHREHHYITHKITHLIGSFLMILYWLFIIVLTVSFAAFGAYVLSEIFL